MHQINMQAYLKLSLIILAVSLLATDAASQEQIGIASAVNRNTTDLTLEQERKLVDAGYQIIQNHVIETDGIGRAQMLLVDGTSLAIGPNSSVVLDRFIYNPITAEGSLEVTAKGLLRIVGGKVTKKQPALIRTNSATVGIRGGIAIVETEGDSTTAAFIYGTQMTMSPVENPGGDISLDRAGFSVTVENPEAEVGFPVLLTEETLGVFQEGFEALEETNENEEDASDEPVAEEEANEPVAEEESNDESAASVDESPEESNDESVVSVDESQEDSSSFEESTGVETLAEEEPDSSVIQPEVDEGILDSSGVSDISSNVAPSSLSTAENFEVNVDLSSPTLEEESEEKEEETTLETAETTENLADEQVVTETSSAVATVSSDGQVVETLEGNGSVVATISDDGVIIAIASSNSEAVADG
ncbi:FecR domain-containing protein, partial [Gammaproteobacteria bacterium]|nr:FecR domain-containing protein [Gammaproteobacteria bacterium]MDA8719994.1 FecR domain-containing protein [bacterium]